MTAIGAPAPSDCFSVITAITKQRAAKLSERLARYGVHAFVAHEDIEPTKEWQIEIERALRSCDALCAFLTPEFVESKWCDQEVGFVVEARKLVVPLRMGADPHGFIGKYQGATVVDGVTITGVCELVIQILLSSPLTQQKGGSGGDRR